MKYHPTFERIAPILVQDFIDEFGLTPEQACGYVGNFGHESSLISGQQEGKPLGITAPIRGRTGGIDWPQWTGQTKSGRRRLFGDFVEANNLPYPSYEASWKFVQHELKGDFKRSIDAVRKTKTLWAAVQTAGYTYEKFAGYEDLNSSNYKTRLGYAQRALDLWLSRHPPKPEFDAEKEITALRELVDELTFRVSKLESINEQ